MASSYKKLISFCGDVGIDILLIHTDGFIEELIPLLIETRVTRMYPFERVVENDLLRIRKNFPDFQIIDGIDKRVLFKDSSKKKIDEELEITEKMLDMVGYIPHIDHLLLSDRTWENFSYYRKKLNHMIDNLS